MQDIQPKHWGGEWKLSPFYSMVVIDNPFSQNLEIVIIQKKFVSQRNGFRPLSDITRDRENMCRIVVCVNYCNRVSNQDLLVYKYVMFSKILNEMSYMITLLHRGYILLSILRHYFSSKE